MKEAEIPRDPNHRRRLVVDSPPKSLLCEKRDTVSTIKRALLLRNLLISQVVGSALLDWATNLSGDSTVGECTAVGNHCLGSDSLGGPTGRNSRAKGANRKL